MLKSLDLFSGYGGIAYRVGRIKSIGNGVVPKQVKEAFEILMGLKELQ